MKKLKVCVYGLGHLGQVTAACLAELGFEVIGLDFVEVPILNEPTLNEMLEKNDKHITFTNIFTDIDDVDYLWVTFDTPVKGESEANEDYVRDMIDLAIFYEFNIPIIISSQLPVGTIKELEDEYEDEVFACVPENLRHGTAIQNFLNPDRIIIGTRFSDDRKKYYPLFKQITDKLIWVKTESAEMIKHSINAFLATSITFANEIGDICIENNVDYDEVLMGLQSEMRIGDKLPLKAGRAYTGGTLARDVKYLIDLSGSEFFKTVKKSNDRRLKK